MKIGILTTGHRPDSLPQFSNYAGMFAELLEGQGLEFENYDVVDGVFPSGVDAAEGWLITGSRHGAYEDHPWIPPLEGFIRDAYAARVPLVGICFGHQIIAQALGGTVEKYSDGWAVGLREYDFGGETLALNAWHQDQVTELPEGAEVVASNAFTPYAGLVYGDRAFSVQPHPEFGHAFVQGLMDTRGAAVPAPLLAAAQAKLGAPVDQPRLAEMIGTFFRERRLK